MLQEIWVQSSVQRDRVLGAAEATRRIKIPIPRAASEAPIRNRAALNFEPSFSVALDGRSLGGIPHAASVQGAPHPQSSAINFMHTA